MSDTICNLCTKPIKWIRTKAGKSMPCDPELVLIKVGTGIKDKTIVTLDGEVFQGEKVDYGYTHIGYESHFATCDRQISKKERCVDGGLFSSL